jgi:4-amino-4-deoxy-L-arabinose transferase-like glycosyltransferase
MEKNQMTTETLPARPLFLKKNLFLGITPAALLLIVIMLLGLALHLYNIQSLGDANAYYTAAVESMLKSWSNFFFAAAEPGGSVTVDKPPLGLWIEAVFAYFLGVSGFSVSLPNILAGLLGIPLLYSMVKKYMGELAGLVAALVTALTPVFVATNRNNTMDGMLVFFLLAAAWAFIRATETGRARWLLLGAFIVGLGFNIKMMQAFLPLPAFYALYFFGSKEGWCRKVLNLGSATVLLTVASLSWAVVVDLTPADQRPYIGSSSDNTVMELILGHNGASRLFGGFHGLRNGPQDGQNPAQGNQPLPSASQAGRPQYGNAGGPPPEAIKACESLTQGASCSFNMPFGTIDGTCITPPNSNQLTCTPQGMIPQNGQNPSRGSQPQAPIAQQGPPQEAILACEGLTQSASCSFNMPFGTIDGTCITPPNSNQLTCAPQGMVPQNGAGQAGLGGPNGAGGGTPFSQETGSPGAFRFFTQPLSKQMSWLLPFALIGIALAFFGARVRLPLESNIHKALVLWGGWLLTCVVFFSMVSGIFHAYYAIMLVPALGAMVGIGFAQLWDWGARNNRVGILLIASAAVTLAFQIFASYQYNERSLWMILGALLFLAGVMLMAVERRLAFVTLLAAMLVIPAYWTIMTVASNPNINLPTAYQGANQQDGAFGLVRARQQGDPRGPNVNQELLVYLQENTQDVEYLLAVSSSQQGASLVLATGRPVLYMGGFTGQDDVVDAGDLSAMVANGELRYVMYGGDRAGKQDIANWLNASCSVIPQFSQAIVSAARLPQGGVGQNQMPNQAGPPNQQMALYLCR